MEHATVGPWTYKGPAIEDGAEDYAILAGGRIIAECFGRTGDNTYAPSAANARLIAAAPELLSACEVALPVLELCRFLPKTKEAKVVMESAIAKAKGTDKPLIGYADEQTTYPCLAPLDELIARMKEHIQVLRETGTE